MMKLAWTKKQIPVLFLGMLIGVVGCGETAPTSPESTDSQTSTPAPAASDSAARSANPAAGVVPTAITARNLTGVWLGEAVLDQQKLQQTVSQLDAEAQKLVGVKVESFLSTVMAMEFREDGTVENEVEIRSTDGKMLRDGSVASWRILESKPNGLLVQTQERIADGSVATDQLFYQFSGDRNRIAIQIPVSQELQGCDAMIVFERQTLPPTNVAAGAKETLTK